ncbi:hypothetical protein FACS1894184_09390 [Clostridia bacterium]|nr:hypothetical protein FACS1894184_09390 [Clostridia bacterium]
MTFYSIRDFRNSSKRVWETLDTRQDVLITNNGKPKAIMLPVSEDDFEDVMSMLIQVRALRAVYNLQAASVVAGLDGMSMDDIDAEIAAVRAERHQ